MCCASGIISRNIKYVVFWYERLHRAAAPEYFIGVKLSGCPAARRIVAARARAGEEIQRINIIGDAAASAVWAAGNLRGSV